MKTAFVEVISLVFMVMSGIIGGLLFIFASAHLYHASTEVHLLAARHIALANIAFSTALLAIVIGIGYSFRFITLFFGILCIRGNNAVGWTSLSSCGSFSRWFVFSWDFFDKGRQRGLRFLGLEVTVEGVLN